MRVTPHAAFVVGRIIKEVEGIVLYCLSLQHSGKLHRITDLVASSEAIKSDNPWFMSRWQRVSSALAGFETRERRVGPKRKWQEKPVRSFLISVKHRLKVGLESERSNQSRTSKVEEIAHCLVRMSRLKSPRMSLFLSTRDPARKNIPRNRFVYLDIVKIYRMKAENSEPTNRQTTVVRL